ncbi:hypothetical protein D9758_002711 [Tetrapyrgos nigripes]|uniref:Uncharacterized protein n=1 Tax=Tetrapyrgos nigripes TaxID=182062 RepID=A0A8H5GQA4_9AGAR|nr:hypothetical protein D9758_002711 [Tetrapyrgos nigripes]
MSQKRSASAVLSDPHLKQRFVDLIKERPNLEERQRWNEANPSFRCKDCITHNLKICDSQDINRTLRCSFCVHRHASCTRLESERRDTTKRQLGLNDEQFDAIKRLLEQEGRLPVRNAGSKGKAKAKAGKEAANQYQSDSHKSNLRPQPANVMSESKTESSSSPSPMSKSKSKSKSKAYSKPGPTSASHGLHPSNPHVLELDSDNSDSASDYEHDMASKNAQLQKQVVLLKKQLRQEERSVKKLTEELQEAQQELGLAQNELNEADFAENAGSRRRIQGSGLVCFVEQEASHVQSNLIESMNIHVLRTRLNQATNGFGEERLSRDEMREVCGNLCEQLLEIADRLVAKAPVGYAEIKDAVKFDAEVVDPAAEREEEEDGYEGPALKRRRRN